MRALPLYVFIKRRTSCIKQFATKYTLLMLTPILFGCLIILISVLIQAYSTVVWLNKIMGLLNDRTYHNRFTTVTTLLSLSFIFFALIHVTQTLIWAGLFYWLPEINRQLSSFSEAWYYSMVTFTSLGYGDITLTGDWRLLSGIEAINGIMLIGWSTAMMYSLIQRIFASIYENKK